MSGDIEDDSVADPCSTANEQDEIGNGSRKMPDKRGERYQRQESKEGAQAEQQISLDDIALVSSTLGLLETTRQDDFRCQTHHRFRSIGEDTGPRSCSWQNGFGNDTKR